MTATLAPPRSRWRSSGAVLVGLVAVFVLSLGTNQVLHSLNVHPPGGQPMYDARLLLLALGYPSWYPIVLALTALPCAWVGGALHRPG